MDVRRRAGQGVFARLRAGAGALATTGAVVIGVGLLAVGTAGLFRKRTGAQLAAEPPEALQVQRDGADFRVVWNRDARLLQSARAAVLSILDGMYSKDIGLDLRLESGMVLYSPKTGDVEFRLRAYGASERTESVRIVGAGPAAPAPAELPFTEPAPQTKMARLFRHRTDEPQQDFPEPAAAHPGAPLTRFVLPPDSLQHTASALPSPPQLAAAAPAEAEAGPPPVVRTALSAAPHPEAIIETVPPPAPAAVPQPQPSATKADATATAPTAASAYTPPRPVARVSPALPPTLRAMLVRDAEVDVTVTVDQKGKVTSALITGTSGVPEKYAIAQMALSAAQSWRFAPATVNSHSVPAEVRLQFRFTRE